MAQRYYQPPQVPQNVYQSAPTMNGYAQPVRPGPAPMPATMANAYPQTMGPPPPPNGQPVQQQYSPTHHPATNGGSYPAMAKPVTYAPPAAQPQYPQQQSYGPPPPSMGPPPPAQGYQQQQQYIPPVQHQPQSQQPMTGNSYNQNYNHMNNRFESMSLNKTWSQMWGKEAVNLLTEKNIKSKPAQNQAPTEDTGACERDVMCCTLTKVPDTASLLQKSRMPFGLLIHPFKDDEEIPVIQDRSIVRCRSCRTYINPFARLLDQRRWQCNVCHRVNDLPDDFLIDMRTNRYLEYPPQQPEIMHGSVEFVAPVEYMVRPPQPAAYLFVFDCSAHAHQLGYLPRMAKSIMLNLDEMPGDSRTLVGFIGFDSNLHFFSMGDKRATHQILPDIQDVFLPYPESFLVNLRQKRHVIEDFLMEMLPNLPRVEFNEHAGGRAIATDTGSALGSALSAAYRALSAIGGRITVFQATLPNLGPANDGSVLSNREDPNNRASPNSAAMTALLNPSTDFYKKLALECSEKQIAVDIFSLSPYYSDLATIGQVAKISGGSLFYYGGSAANTTSSPDKVLARFEADLSHYLTRRIGFEAVMRLRCTRGLSIHTFHGNFFVRSTDLLTLPNVNPDAGYAMQISIEEDLKDFNNICFQAAVLYTNAAGERRIRVHTISVPVTSNVAEVLHGVDQEAVVGMLCKMAVDRSLSSNLSDAREAAINAVIDLLGAYRAINPSDAVAGLVTTYSTRLLPIYVLALLKHIAFRVGISTKTDERYVAMERMKNLPMVQLMTYIYPNLYPVHYEIDWKNEAWPSALQLSFANIERNGVYLLDTYDNLYLYICKSVNPQWLVDVLGVSQWAQIPDDGDNVPSGVNGRSQLTGQPVPPLQNGIAQEHNDSDLSSTQSSSVVPLPEYDNSTSVGLRAFVEYLLESRPLKPHFFILREDSSIRYSFLQYMYDDRNESAFSYYEFLQHLQQQLKN